MITRQNKKSNQSRTNAGKGGDAMITSKRSRGKTICQVAFVTLSVLGAAKLMILPETNSRFVTKSTETESLKYSSHLDRVHKDAIELFEQDGTDHDNVNLFVSFDRNDVIAPLTSEDRKDTYTMEIPTGCYVTEGQTESVYDNTSMETITVSLSCDVKEVADAADGRVSVPIVVYETLDGDSKFVYQKMAYDGGTLEEYYENHSEEPPGPPGPPDYTKDQIKVQGNLREIYEAFIKWVDAHKGEYPDEVDKYVRTVYDLYNEYTFLDSTKTGEVLQGLGLTLTEKDGVYTMKGTIDANFIGYARTNADTLPLVYFSTTTEGNLEEAFRYYMETYFEEDEAYGNIADYLIEKSNHNIAAVIDGTVIINGITPFIAESADPNDPLINTKDRLRIVDWVKDVAYNYNNRDASVRISFYSTSGSMFSAFRYSLDDVPGLTDQAITSMSTNPSARELRNSIITNLTQDRNGPKEPIAYTDYFTFRNTANQFVLLKVSSNPIANGDGTYSDAYTTVDFAFLDTDLDIEFTNGKDADLGKLTITIEYPGNYNDPGISEELNATIDQLEQYFGKDVTISDPGASNIVQVTIEK